jgi:hypothetical protein
MEETTAWLESEGHDLMRADRLQNNQVRLTSSASPRGVELITLANCVLYVRMADLVWPERTYDLAVVLRELRPGGVRVEPDTLPSGYPVYTVRLYIANPNAMSTIYANGKVRAIRVAGLPVQGAEDGQRIANAITHAATLCGASDPGAF